MERDTFKQYMHENASPLCTLMPERSPIDVPSPFVPSSGSSSTSFTSAPAIIVTDTNGEFRTYQPPQTTQHLLMHTLPPSTQSFSAPLTLATPIESYAASPRDELLERRAPFDAEQFLEDWLEQQRLKEEQYNGSNQTTESEHHPIDVTPSNPELEASVSTSDGGEVFDDEESKPVAMTFRSLAVPAMDASASFHSPARPLNNSSQSSVTPTKPLSPRTEIDAPAMQPTMLQTSIMAPPPEEAINLLNRLPDAEYRQVVDVWIRSLLQQQQQQASAVSPTTTTTYLLPLPPSPLPPLNGTPDRRTTAAATLNSPISYPPPQSPQSIQSTLLQSYVTLRPWAYSPPLLLERVFAYLPVRELAGNVKSVCTRWKTSLEAIESIGGPRLSPFVWSTSQMLTFDVDKFQSHVELTPAFKSLPLLRALRFESNLPAGMQQLSPPSPQSANSFNSPTTVDVEASWSWKVALRNVTTQLPLLSRLELEQVHGLRSEDFKSLLPAHSILSPPPLATTTTTQFLFSTSLPKSFALRALSLKRCMAIDAACLELLSQLPSLEELVLESTSPLTPSKSTGLHFFSSACSSHSVLRSPTLASPYAPPPDVCFPSLVYLSLAPLSSDACLTHLIRCTQLRSLNLTGALSDLGIESLCVLTNLTSLSIQCMYDFHSAASASSPASSYRQSLSASELEGLCDGHGVAALEAIENLTELSVLIPALNFQGIEAICSLQNLKSLKIATHFPSDTKTNGANSPSSATAQQTQMTSPLTSNLSFLSVLYVLIDLTCIDLSGCPWLSDEHLSWLCDPLLCDRLRCLRLTNLKRISDISAYWVSKLIKLQQLDMRGTSLTLRGAKEIRSKLSGCVVLHHVDPSASPQAAVRKKRLSTSKKSNLDVVEEGAESISPRVTGEEYLKPSTEVFNQSTQTDEVDSKEAEAATESSASSEISVQADIKPIAKQVSSFQTQTEEIVSTSKLSMSGLSVHTIMGEDNITMSHSGVQTDDFVAIAYEQLLTASQLKAEKMLQQAELLKAQKGLAELTAELRQQGAQPLSPNKFISSRKPSALPSPSHTTSNGAPALTLADLSASEGITHSLQSSPSSAAALHKKKVRSSNKKKPKPSKELKRSVSNTSDNQLSDGGESERRRSNRRTPFLLATLTSKSTATENSSNRIFPSKNLSVPRLNVNSQSLEPYSDSPTSASSTPARSSFLIPVAAPLHMASIVSTTSNSPSHTPSAGSSPVLSRKGFLPPALIPSPPAAPFLAHQHRVSSKMTPLSSPLASNNVDFALAFAQSQSPPLIARAAASPVVSAHNSGENAFKDMKITLLGPSALLPFDDVEPNGDDSLPAKQFRMNKRSILQDGQGEEEENATTQQPIMKDDTAQPSTETFSDGVKKSSALIANGVADRRPSRDVADSNPPKIKRRGSSSPFFSSTFTPRSLLSVTESLPIAVNGSIPQLSLAPAAVQSNGAPVQTSTSFLESIPTIDVTDASAETDELINMLLTSPIQVSSVSLDKQTAPHQTSNVIDSGTASVAVDSTLNARTEVKSPMSAVAYGNATPASDAVSLHRSRRKKSISKFEAKKELLH